MDSLVMGFSSPKNPPDPAPSGESNENDVCHNQLDFNSKSQNPKKFAMKHFMSPTASTKSKFVPRKTIWAENNESLISSESANAPKFPNLNSRKGLLHSGSGTSRCHQVSTLALSACSDTSKSDDEDLSNSSVDSSLKTYDPLTNYLCPRPKYLRYKPNRRHRILLSGDFGVKEDTPFPQGTGVLNSHNQNFVDEEKTSKIELEPLTSPVECCWEIPIAKKEKENDYDVEDTDDEEEEDEEFVEEQGWTLKGMLKFLLLLVVIALTTSYLSTMNGPTPSPVVEGIGFLRDGLCRTHRRLFEAVSANVQSHAWVNGSGMQVLDAQTGFLEVNRPFVNEIVQVIQQCDGLTGDIRDHDEVEEDLNQSYWETAGYEGKDGGKAGSDDQLQRWEISEFDVATVKDLKKVEDDFGGLHQCAALYDAQSASGIEHDDQIIEGNQLENDHYTNDSEGNFGIRRSEEMAWIGSERTANTTSIEDEIFHQPSDEVDGSFARESVEITLDTDVATVKDLKKVEDDFGGLHQCAALYDAQSASGIEHDDQIIEGNQLENDHYTNDSEGNFGVTRTEEMARIGSERTANTTGSIEDEIFHQPSDEVDGSSARESVEITLDTELQTSESTASCVEDSVFVPAYMDSNNKELDACGIDVDVKSMEVAKFMNLGSFSVSAILFSLLYIVLASLVCIYSTRWPYQAPPQDSFLEVSDRKKELISVQPSMEFENRQEKAESIVKPSSARYSFDETTREYTHNQAPDVKLLGEFEIAEHSSSLSSSGRKGGRIIETEESLNPISHVAHVESQSPPVAPVRLLNVSNADSSSFGSFSSVKILLRKEGGRDGGAQLVTTPVRRSSRIRSLSVTSP